MPKFIFQPLHNGIWEIPYSDVIKIRRSIEALAAPASEIESFVLGKPSEAQRRTIASLVRVRPDRGSDYEAAMAFNFSLRVECDGTCHAADAENFSVGFLPDRGWFMGLVRQDFETFDAAMSWLANHKRHEVAIGKVRR